MYRAHEKIANNRLYQTKFLKCQFSSQLYRRCHRFDCLYVHVENILSVRTFSFWSSACLLTLFTLVHPFLSHPASLSPRLSSPCGFSSFLPPPCLSALILSSPLPSHAFICLSLFLPFMPYLCRLSLSCHAFIPPLLSSPSHLDPLGAHAFHFCLLDWLLIRDRFALMSFYIKTTSS